MKWIISYTKFETMHINKQAHYPGSGPDTAEQGRHNTGLLLGQGARIPRHTVDINLVFRSVLKEKTTITL